MAYSIAEWHQEQRLREAYGKLERQHAVDASLVVNWRNLFRHYYRMWGDLSGLRNDFAALIERKIEHPEHDAVEIYAPSSIHYFASYLVYLHRFEDEMAGHWLLSSPDREVAAREAAYRITWHVPADDLEQSWLREELRAVPAKEKHGFLQRLSRQAKGRAFIARWGDWMRQCNCPPEDPSSQCEIHKIIELCDLYLEIIDNEWNRIADWYRLPSKTIGVGTAAPNVLFKDFDYTMPELQLYSQDDDKPDVHEDRSTED